MPLLTPVRVLPPATPGGQPATDLLRFLGRTLEIVPTAGLLDPALDPTALAHEGEPGKDTAFQVVARLLESSAPKASEVPAALWTAWQCSPVACQETVADERHFLPLTPFFNNAGWFQLSPPTNPVSLVNPGNWTQWVNVTGLVAGVTRFGDELQLLFTPAVIAAAAVRDQLTLVWNGTTFVP